MIILETEETKHLRQVILARIACRQRFGVGRAWRVSIPSPFHSISFPALEKADDLEGLVELGIHVYMMVGFLNTCIVVMFDLIEKN